jgi:hypothetical protein
LQQWLRERASILRTFPVLYIVDICMYVNNKNGTHCYLSITTMVTLTPYNVTLYVHCVSCCMEHFAAQGIKH